MTPLKRSILRGLSRERWTIIDARDNFEAAIGLERLGLVEDRPGQGPNTYFRLTEAGAAYVAAMEDG
jgi:hypothetical protein